MPSKLWNLSPVLKTAWREIFYRIPWYRDNFAKLERLFRWSEDPWNFERSPYEQERFRSLLKTVRELPHDTILEVGCGEGTFTHHLTSLKSQIVAIDVSATAISRARQRCPNVTLLQRSLHDFSSHLKFDLVLCLETLYYVKDVQRAIERLSSLGRFCMVSYLDREQKTLDPFFERMQLVKSERFEKSYGLWRRGMTLVVWENP